MSEELENQVRESIEKVNQAVDGLRIGGNASITISHSSLFAVLVGFIAVIGIVVAVASVLVVSARREADMEKLEFMRQDMTEFRQRLELVEIQTRKNTERVTNLENRRQ